MGFIDFFVPTAKFLDGLKRDCPIIPAHKESTTQAEVFKMAEELLRAFSQTLYNRFKVLVSGNRITVGDTDPYKDHEQSGHISISQNQSTANAFASLCHEIIHTIVPVGMCYPAAKEFASRVCDGSVERFLVNQGIDTNGRHDFIVEHSLFSPNTVERVHNFAKCNTPEDMHKMMNDYYEKTDCAWATDMRYWFGTVASLPTIPIVNKKIRLVDTFVQTNDEFCNAFKSWGMTPNDVLNATQEFCRG